jgi:hypothetical protein
MGRTISRRMTWAAAAGLATAACAGDPSPQAGVAPSSPCVLEQAPLVLADGAELYIEPQTLFRLGGEWIVVGAPSYQWSVAPGRGAIELSREAHVAAVLGDPARAIEKPLPDERIGSVLSTPLDDGHWAAIFDVVEPDSIPASAFPLTYWYGEHDGSRWTLVEPLPTPPGSKLDLRQSSQLVRVGDTLVWISFERAPVGSRLHRYERRDGVWRYERLPDEWVEHVALAHDPDSGLWMAVLGPDADLPRYEKSIRLYREGPRRELVSRVESLPGGPMVLQLELEVRGSATVSWLVVGPEGPRAFTRTDIRPGSAGPVTVLDDDALHLYSMTMSDGSLAWLAEHEERVTGDKELRLLRLDGSRVVRVASAPSPFTGFFRAQPSGPSEVLLVGPEMGLVPPETPVRSLILRLSTSC